MYKFSSTQKIQVVLAAAKTSVDCPVTAVYQDLNETGFPLSAITTALVNTNGVTAVDVVASPSSGTSRLLKTLTVINTDTGNITLTFQYYVGSTATLLITKDLGPGDVLHYEDGEGWQVHRKRERTLAEGQVASGAGGTLYTSTGMKTVGLYLFNTNTTTETTFVYITKSGGTLRNIRQISLVASDSYELRRIMLSPGDVLGAGTTTGSKVNYIVFRDPLTEE